MARPQAVIRRDGSSYPASLPTREAREDRGEEVRRLRVEEELSPIEIARRLKISPRTVYRYLDEEGIAADEDPVGGEQPAPVVADPRAWFELDFERDPPWLCLSALEAAATELAGKAKATELVTATEHMQRLCFALAKRIRGGNFAYEPAPASQWGAA